MAKDAYWFRHDSNAATDPKMIRLIGKYGCAGYGAFWRVIEFIHAHCDGKLSMSDVDVLAAEYRYPELPAMISDCQAWGLFEKDGECLMSHRLNEELELLAERKNASRNASRMRWASDMRGASATHSAAQSVTHARRNAQTEKTDREDNTDKTEKTDRDPDPDDTSVSELGDRGPKGKGETNPPPASPAGLERPAGPPAEDFADEDPEKIAEAVSQQLGPSVIDFGALPPHMRVATERARLKLEADARAKAEHLAQKTADYHAGKTEGDGRAPVESIAPTPADPGFLAAPKPRASPDPAVDDFEDFPEEMTT